MILYHGTDKKGDDKIIKNGYISVTTDKNRRYVNTTLGNVYLTKNLADAIKFSTQPQRGVTDYPVIIFEVELDESELELDKDEEKWNSTITTDGYKECYIVKRNLVLGKDVKRRFFKYFSDAYDAGKFMQDVQYGKTVINDNEWKEVP